MSHAMTWYQLSDAGMNTLTPSVPASSAISSSSHNDIIAPNLRAVAYGDGFFSTMGVHNGKLLWQSYHKARLMGHCQALQLTIPPTVERQLWNELHQFAATISEGLIKVILSRPAQSLRGYAYSTQAADNEALIWLGVMQTATLAEHTAQFLSGDLDNDQSLGQQVLQQPPIIAKCLQSQLASLPQPLAGLKSLNRLDGVMIAGELQRHKQHNPELAEGLVADMSGNWVEGVMSNFFYRLKPALNTDGQDADSDVWYTPPIEQSGVRGVMRQVIIDKLAKLGAPAKLRYLRNEDLSQLEAMFFCNAVRGVVPVQQLWFQDERFQLSLAPFIKNSVLK
ncbi:aminotransferase class IV [Psychrobacter phenylpyruvicus]|uniref:branched-chain-amino-acid transaminase n=1 Tax=Psychrobacter phenylpyruvicus TaxID=29432 RepID=A0A379LPB4_9GAMM|nr:aminotransferase class IV [Psychrobacter phenylpyruvicus]SUD91955.1 Aminodeoxychorismate lyase [Psychrobacter phenylpyruvicus]